MEDSWIADIRIGLPNSSQFELASVLISTSTVCRTNWQDTITWRMLFETR